MVLILDKGVGMVFAIFPKQNFAKMKSFGNPYSLQSLVPYHRDFNTKINPSKFPDPRPTRSSVLIPSSREQMKELEWICAAKTHRGLAVNNGLPSLGIR